MKQLFERYIKLAVLLYIGYLVIYFTFYAVTEQRSMQRQQEFNAISAGLYLENVANNLSETVYVLRNSPAIGRIMYAPLAVDPYDYVLAYQELERQVAQLGMVESCYLYIHSSGTILASGWGKYDISDFYDANFLRSINPNVPVSFSVHRPEQALLNQPASDYVTLTIRFSTALRVNAGYICLNLSKDKLLENLEVFVKAGQYVRVSGPEGPLFGTTLADQLADDAFFSLRELNVYGLSLEVGQPKAVYYQNILRGFFKNSLLFLGFSILSGLLLAVLISTCNNTFRSMVFQLADLYNEMDDSSGLGLDDLSYYFSRLVEDNKHYALQIQRVARVAREKLLLDLLTGADPESEEYQEECQLFNLHFSKACYWTAYLLISPDPAIPPSKKQRWDAVVLLRSQLERAELRVLSTAGGDGNVAAVFDLPETSEQQVREQLTLLTEQLEAALEELPGLRLHVAYDGPVRSENELAHSFARARRRAGWRLALKNQEDLLFGSIDLPTREALLPESLRGLLVAAAQTRSYAPVYTAATEMQNREPEVEPLRLQLCAMAILLLLHSPAEPSKTMAAALSENLKQLHTAPNPAGLHTAFCGFLGELSKTEPMPVEENPKNQYVVKAIEFLCERYDRELSVSEIAEHLSLNEKYLSRLFKDSTGKTIMQYLSELRMRKAVELLSCTRLTVQKVGEMIGFGDSRSFIRHFKRTYGLTPGEYRVQHADAPAREEQAIG